MASQARRRRRYQAIEPRPPLAGAGPIDAARARNRQGSTPPMQGFPKSRRLLRHSDFRRVYSEGRRYFAAHMTVFYVPRQDPGDAGWRVGYTVGKVLGGAVERNRIKRRLREAVRLSEFQSAIAADIVIHPKPSLAARDFSRLRAEIEKAFQAVEKSLAKEKLEK